MLGERPVVLVGLLLSQSLGRTSTCKHIVLVESVLEDCKTSSIEGIFSRL